jgi:transketolase C-terminal domain/subunit
MADNTCHFGINSFFADNGLDDVQSWLYFPADALQMNAIIKRVFFERGMRFVFSTRAKVPYLLKPDSDQKLFGDGYEFVPGKDEIILEGKAGYVVSYGDTLYRSYDAVLRVRQEGLDVGLVNKPTLNLIDEQVSTCPCQATHRRRITQTIRKIGSSPFVLIVESLSRKTGVCVVYYIASYPS